jgi:hypothetical protein
VRDILAKDKNIKNLIFDTTGIGYFEAGKEVPELEKLNEALVEGRSEKVKVTSLTEVELPKADGVFEIAIKGLG